MKPKIHPILTALFCTGLCVSTAHADRIFPAWVQLQDLSVARSQNAQAVAVDSRGNVAVTGFVIDETSTEALYVAKYDTLNGNPITDGPKGRLIWEKTFRPANGTARGLGIACDSVGNVIVTGWTTTQNSPRDYITIKFAAADGAELWQKPYNNDVANGADEGMRVTVDRADNVIVTGKSAGSGTNADIHTIKYSSIGTVLWQRRYNHPGNRDDFPSSIAVDPNNDFVIVAGTADLSGPTKFYVGKYRASDGANNVAGAWEKTFTSGAQGATDLAVDTEGNAIVAGPAYVSSQFTKDIHTIKYQASDGTELWSRNYATNEFNSWAGVAVDYAGDVFITGTSGVNINGRRIYIAKYSGTDGALPPLWEAVSPAPDKDDEAKGIAVDPAGTVAVIGRSNSLDTDLQDEFYMARFDGASGAPREEFSFNGNDSGGTDIPMGIAMDRTGGFAVVGTIKKPRATTGIIYDGIATIKFNRLLAVTGDPATGTGVPAGAKLAALSTPALADDGAVAARVTLAINRARLGGIFTQGGTGAPQIAAVQGAVAPGTPAAKYGAFLDPVISQRGKIAFIATLAGVPRRQAFAVFSDVTGTMTRHLQQGQTIPGLPAESLPAGTVLGSVSSISIRGAGLSDELVALVTLAGPEINRTNNVALLGINAGGTTVLLRTGADLNGTKIAAITTLTSVRGSIGHGRWQSNSRIVARVVLADRRVANVVVPNAGGATALLTTGMNASLFAAESKWSFLGTPANGSGSVSAALGFVAGGGVPATTDSALVYTTNANTFNFIAREGDDAAGVPNAKYAAFGEPVVSLSNEVSFMGVVAGAGVRATNRTGIWTGALSPNFVAPTLVARQGDKATDSRGNAGVLPWTSFLTLAHPGGVNAGPIFLAKVAGKRNNIGVWAQDSGLKLRQTIRVGDVLGGQIVTSVSLLQGTAGVAGATRSFNNTGGVGVLLGFRNRTQAIYYLGIP